MVTITKPRAVDVLDAIGYIDYHNNAVTVDDVTVRIKMGPDYHTQISDFDCYGKIEPVERNRWGAHEKDRPAGFDGAAEKLRLRDGELWWQPPLFDKEDYRRWHTDSMWRRELRTQIVDILEFGFTEITVEILRGADAYNRPIVVDAWHLGGIEPYIKQDDLRDVLHDFMLDTCEFRNEG